MSRHENRRTPKVVSGMLYTDDAATGIALDTPAWFTWLTTATTFYYQSPDGFFTAHHEVRRRDGTYWIAYRQQNGRLHRLHLGKPDHLTRHRLRLRRLVLGSTRCPACLSTHSPEMRLHPREEVIRGLLFFLI